MISLRTCMQSLGINCALHFSRYDFFFFFGGGAVYQPHILLSKYAHKAGVFDTEKYEGELKSS